MEYVGNAWKFGWSSYDEVRSTSHETGCGRREKSTHVEEVQLVRCAPYAVCKEE